MMKHEHVRSRGFNAIHLVPHASDADQKWFALSVTVRHEKKGWGVLDISGASEYKTPGFSRPGQTKRR